MGVKGLRTPVTGPTRAETRSAKHMRKVTTKARGGSGGCIVWRNGVAENLIPKTIKELIGK